VPEVPFEEDALAVLSPAEMPGRRPGFVRRMAAGAWHLLSGAWFLLRHPSFWPLAALPTLLAVVCILLGIALGAFAIPWLETHVLPGRGKIAAGIGILLSLALYLGTLLAGAVAGLAVAMLVTAPILERLSRRVEAFVRVTVPEHQGGLKWEIAQAFRGALYFLFAAPVVLLLSLIPLLGPPLALLWGAHSVAFQQTDMPLARRGMDFGQRRAWHRQYRPESMGFGLVGLVFMFVPLANFLVAPALTVGGTLMVLELEEDLVPPDRPERRVRTRGAAPAESPGATE
jgi:uncharacterized protein involved in cysteine biosynthesis